MGHHVGNETTSKHWTEHCNEMIHRVCTLYPENFVGVCQLPQSPGFDPRGVIPELVRCVEEFGFVGCNLNPDPSGGKFSEPPLTDRWSYPVYEKLCELDVPAMVHVSQSCNPAFHTVLLLVRGHRRVHAAHDVGPVQGFSDTALIIPHGGGAVPFRWGPLLVNPPRFRAPTAARAHVRNNVSLRTPASTTSPGDRSAG